MVKRPVAGPSRRSPHGMRLGLIASRSTPANRALCRALVGDTRWEEFTTQEALDVLGPGDGALGRLDVSPGLDGIDDGLWAQRHGALVQELVRRRDMTYACWWQVVVSQAPSIELRRRVNGARTSRSGPCGARWTSRRAMQPRSRCAPHGQLERRSLASTRFRFPTAPRDRHFSGTSQEGDVRPPHPLCQGRAAGWPDDGCPPAQLRSTYSPRNTGVHGVCTPRASTTCPTHRTRIPMRTPCTQARL